MHNEQFYDEALASDLFRIGHVFVDGVQHSLTLQIGAVIEDAG